MLDFDDTGRNVPEPVETLFLQQRQLIQGKRPAQMFPNGTREIPLPEGFKRHRNARGIFHYNPEILSPGDIDAFSEARAENHILLLGPYSKIDVVKRARDGDTIVAVTELIGDIEIRCVATNRSLLKEITRYFRDTKEPESRIEVGPLPPRFSHFSGT